MAELAAAMPYISMASTAFGFIGGMQEASAQEAYGRQQQAIAEMQARNAKVVAERNAQIIRDQSEYAARSQEVQAGQERATAQREAMMKRRERDLVMSRARAVGASSSGDTLDPTALNLTGDLYETGEMNGLNALWSGDSLATTLESKAGLTRYEGETDAEMTRYGGNVDSQLLKYQGAVQNYQGQTAASSSRMKSFGTAFGGLASVKDAPWNKYNTYKPGISPSQYVGGDVGTIYWNAYR